MVSNAKTVAEYEIVDHGVEHNQYFQGCGTAFTRFTDVATGVGDDPQAALDDALESLAQSGWDVEEIFNAAGRDYPTTNIQDETGELGYYVSVRVR
jgi:hypothetical protein